MVLRCEGMMIYFFLDPIEHLHGPVKPSFLIARELRDHFDFSFISPLVNDTIAKILRSYSFKVFSLVKHFTFSGSLLTFESWLRRSEFKLKSTKCVVVNFSQCFLTDAHVYYAQGPITRALNDMYPEMNRTYKFTYKFLQPFFVKRDKSFIKKLRRRSRSFIANSKFCASMYEDWDIKVDDMIYPPLDCNEFKPTTCRPSGNYVLTYLGKEAKYSVLKAIADAGVKIKAFGVKVSHIPSFVLKHPNIEFLNKVSDEELVDSYSNALYTLFTFTHEPFGYIPIESMACGTPVLTYNKQGPSESLINKSTGWLVKNDKELTDLALKLWKEGYPQSMRTKARERALLFEVKSIAEKWMEVLKNFY